MWLSRDTLKIYIKNLMLLGYRVHLNNAIHFSAATNVLIVATFGVRAKPNLILSNISQPGVRLCRDRKLLTVLCKHSR